MGEFADSQSFGFLYVLCVLMEVLTIALTFSRSSLIVAVPGTIIVSTVLCFKKKVGRIGYWIAYGLVFVAVVTIFIIYRRIFIDKIKELFVGDLTGNGRTDLWEFGYEAWKEFPIFGLSIWYLPPINNWYYSIRTYVYQQWFIIASIIVLCVQITAPIFQSAAFS